MRFPRTPPPARAQSLIPIPPPSSSQAPNPCEWAPGLGWRSHREATPGGRPRRGACELDNGAEEDGPTQESSAPMSVINLWLLSAPVRPCRAGAAA